MIIRPTPPQDAPPDAPLEDQPLTLERAWAPLTRWPDRHYHTPRGLGIGVITYNRLATLQKCIENVLAFTTAPFHLVVADDGSSDGTAAWCRASGVPVVSGRNQGCAWNKNRALGHLLEATRCDPILLLEEDTWPNVVGWEQPWLEAAYRWQHVNYAKEDLLRDCYIRGAGRPDSPYVCKYMTGQATISTRASLYDVGYLDTRFVGWGDEHVEHTVRYMRALGNPPWEVPALRSGLEMVDVGSYIDMTQQVSNQGLRFAIENEHEYRPPARDDLERARFAHEQARAAWPHLARGHDREAEGHALVSVVCPTRNPDLARRLAASFPTGHFEVVWVWNGEGDCPLQGRVVNYREPFNYEEAVNRGVAASRGSVLLIVNDDVELVAPGLFSELLRVYDAAPQVGVVRPGGPGPWRPDDDPTAPAWDGACWAISRRAFYHMGGLDETVTEYGGDEILTRLQMARLGYQGLRLQGWDFKHELHTTYGAEAAANYRHMAQVAASLGYAGVPDDPTRRQARAVCEALFRQG